MRDPYVWIDPWAEMQRLSDQLDDAIAMAERAVTLGEALAALGATQDHKVTDHD